MDIEFDIDVTYYNDNWGNYIVSFPICTSATANDGIIPYNTTITGVEIEAYLGKVLNRDSLSGETEIVGLIDSNDTTPFVQNDNEVGFTLAHPGTAYENQNATLVFKLTIAGDKTRAFYGYPIRIRAA
ncbi:MAG: hypothetical protein DRJ64_09300 [Thermoprotei archaeon]|nr:MAG: hypothetical protein DRJ64_09300 [Thermoprotei archaeon]